MNLVGDSNKQLVDETRKQVAAFVMGGLAITIGLSWNEAVKSSIDEYFPLQKSGGVQAKFTYALILTILMVLLTIFIVNMGIYKEAKPCICAEQTEVQTISDRVNQINAERYAEKIGLI